MGWFGSKKPAAPNVAGEPGTNPERYTGKPLLRLLELYALWAVDQLPEGSGETMQKLAPKLTELYGGDGTWQGALATTLDLPKNMPQLIRGLWDKNQEIAAANGVELGAQQFAEMFVDKNFS